MDIRRSHRLWPVASRIYVDVKISRKIQTTIHNYAKTMSSDVTMYSKVICINKLWNPMEMLGHHHSYDRFSWISLNIPGIPGKFHFWKHTGK